MNPSDEQRLEETIHRTLRSLPARRAPRTLESRVLAEIARRAALPWWRQSYAHWPVAARGSFFVLSALAAAVAIAGCVALAGGGAGAFAEFAGRFAWLASAKEVVAFVTDTGATLWRSIPPLWLYGTLAFVATCYATLVGVGAAAWRMFHAPR